MRKMPLAQAKAHFSEVVDEVARRHRRVVILRRGHPVAALVPLEDLKGSPSASSSVLKDREIEALWASFGTGDTSKSALDDLTASRSRFESNASR